MGATWRFQGCFKSVSQVTISKKKCRCLIEVQSSCEGVSRLFCFWKFFCMSPIAATRAEGGLVLQSMSKSIIWPGGILKWKCFCTTTTTNLPPTKLGSPYKDYCPHHRITKTPTAQVYCHLMRSRKKWGRGFLLLSYSIFILKCWVLNKAQTLGSKNVG